MASAPTVSKPEKAGDDAEILRVVVGTAGHIDHGKSSLVLRLTGIDPDRLPEEKTRGLTIDLGFANFLLSNGWRVGMVDVPGHERFVHNMVAGATGVDLVMLVVAADDGVKPQTIEHLEILQLLGLRRGLIALNKVDAVTDDLRELAVAEVRDLVRGTFLERAPIVPVSARTGEGIDALRKEIETLALATPPRRASGVFRMPVQRVFAAKGFGCVLTGIPLSGTVAIGDAVEVLPERMPGTIRGLEAYHRTVTKVSAGHSSAMNINGVDAARCARGMVVATPGYFEPGAFAAVRFDHPARRRKPLRDRTTVRIHTGTREIGAILTFLDRTELAPGSSAFAQCAFEEPLTAAPGDRFLARLPSPAENLGGGVLLRLLPERLKRNRPRVIADLEATERALGDLPAMLLLEAHRAGAAPVKPRELAVRCGALESEALALIEAHASSGAMVRVRGGALVEKEAFLEARRLTLDAVGAFFKAHPERLVCERLDLRERTRLDSLLLDEVLADLAKHRCIELEPGGGARAVKKDQALSPELAALREKVLRRVVDARFQPPSNEELASETKAPRKNLDAVLKRLVDEKLVVRICPEFHMGTPAVDEARAAVMRQCSKSGARGGEGEVDLPALRDEFQTTRRWLIPLMEWFDATGFTTRLGARRILKK